MSRGVVGKGLVSDALVSDALVSERVATVRRARAWWLALVLGSWSPACSGGEDPQPTLECDDTWESFAAGHVRTWCTSCHSAGLPDGLRYGAPIGVDFDTLDEVQQWAERIEVRTALDSSSPMPPAGGVPEEEVRRFSDWLACGLRGDGTAPAPTCADAVERPGDAEVGGAAEAEALCAGGPITVGGDLRVGGSAALGCVCAVAGGVTVTAGVVELPQLASVGADLRVEAAAEQVLAHELEAVGGSVLAEGVASLAAFDLLSLREVGGDVRVTDAPLLEAFLPAQLVAVPGSFVVERTGVTAVDLTRLVTVDGDLRVVDAPMTGLWGDGGALERVGGDLVLADLPEWTGFYGFGYLLEVGGDLRIERDDALTLLRGFNKLESVGGTLSVSDNLLLNGINGFDQVTDIGGDLRIADNPSIQGNDGFDTVSRVGGEVLVARNPVMAVPGPLVAELDEAGAVTFEALPALVELPAFPELDRVDGDLRFVDVGKAPVLDGFFGLDTVGGALVLEALPALTTLNLRTTTLPAIGGDLRVRAVGLAALPLPSSLRTVGGALVIEDNAALADVSGVHGLETVSGDLTVTGNPKLSAAEAQALSTQIESVGGVITIEGNGP